MHTLVSTVNSLLNHSQASLYKDQQAVEMNGPADHSSHAAVYNSHAPHYSIAGDKPTNSLHGNSHMTSYLLTAS